ncbi:hypothetical protein RCL1_009078 [Eukaryota sp. TZLM3-RCL]
MDCSVCLIPFDENARQPLIICSNNHSICKDCIPSLKICPFCRSRLIPNPQCNRDLLHLLSALATASTSSSTVAPLVLDSPLSSPPFSEV